MKHVILAAAMLLSLAGSAFAVDFNAVIKGIDGAPMMNGKEPLTLKSAVAQALLSSYPDEQALGGPEKVARFQLWQKIESKPDNPALTADVIALIKKLVGKAYNPLIVGQAWLALDPASVKQ